MVVGTVGTFVVRGETAIRIACIVSCAVSSTYFALQPTDMTYALVMELALFVINAYYLVRDYRSESETRECLT